MEVIWERRKETNILQIMTKVAEVCEAMHYFRKITLFKVNF